MSNTDIHLTVATVVEDAGRFLLVSEEDKGEIVYNQPAGHWEPGETLIAAARRETLEETGWEVEIVASLGMALYQLPGGSGDTTDSRPAPLYCRVSFLAGARIFHPEAEIDADIIASHWHTEEEIRAMHDKMRSPLVLNTLAHYHRGTHLPLDAFDHFL